MLVLHQNIRLHVRPALRPPHSQQQAAATYFSPNCLRLFSNGDDDGNAGNLLRHVHDAGKPTSFSIEPVNDAPNPVPHLITANSLSNSTQFLMQTTSSPSNTWVGLPAALITTSNQLMEMAFPRDSLHNPPITVGDLPLNPSGLQTSAWITLCKFH